MSSCARSRAVTSVNSFAKTTRPRIVGHAALRCTRRSVGTRRRSLRCSVTRTSVGHATAEGFEVRANAVRRLISALRAVTRPAEKVRVAVH